MNTVVPCSALIDLLLKDDRVIKERREEESHHKDAPKVINESSAPPTKADNPRGREDFNQLLDAAVSGKKPKSEK
jgi:hypothetical protein